MRQLVENHLREINYKGCTGGNGSLRRENTVVKAKFNQILKKSDTIEVPEIVYFVCEIFCF